MATFQTSNSTRGYGGVAIYKNEVNILSGFQQCEAQYSWGHVSVSGILDVASGDTIKCELARNGSQIVFTNQADSRNVFSAVKIS